MSTQRPLDRTNDASPRIALWTERGIPYAEVRTQLMHRSDAECAQAFQLLRTDGFLNDPLLERMRQVIAKGEDTLPLLNQLETLLQEQLAKHNTPMSPGLTSYLELQALVVEHLVRERRALAS